jgi:hypothetical protein
MKSFTTGCPQYKTYILNYLLSMIQSIKDVLEKGPKVSNWHDSEKTREMVAAQIAERWGESEVKNYDPERNCLPFVTWLNLGFRPKPKSKALTSVTYIERRDSDGRVISKYPRKICLFYYRDVMELKPTDSHA